MTKPTEMEQLYLHSLESLEEDELERPILNAASVEHTGLSDDQLARKMFREHVYPYAKRMQLEAYYREMYPLQIELVKLQNWVKTKRQKIVIVFEGRDAAGKGSTIRRFIEHLNPRGARVVALDKPTEAEREQWYFQRYVDHLPTAGEIVFFDRSWYNRAGVERVMGFCSEEEYWEFIAQTPDFERMLVRSGVRLFKLYLSVGREEQARRFKERETNPLKQWKLSPIDVEAQARWDDYDLRLTVLSLVMAISSTSLGFYVASKTQKSILIEIGGLMFGLGIAAMHYVGIEAIRLEGAIRWSGDYIVLSLVFAGLFGIMTTNRVARPIGRFCIYGGSIGFILAVALLHFTSMAGMELVPDFSNASFGKAVSDDTLGYSIIFVMLLMMTTALITYILDSKNLKSAQAQFRHLALRDTLTGLPNRISSEQHLNTIIAQGVGDTANIAIVVFGIDRFKQINDAHGHGVGDLVLKSLAERIESRLDKGEFFARFGGDEFVAIKYPVYAEKNTDAFCKRLIALVNETISIKEFDLSVAASCGYALYPVHSETPADLLEKADLAMYRAKSTGKNAVAGYDRKLDEQNREKSTLVWDLSKALERGQFELEYQLQNYTNNGKVSGVEALLRWNHPKKGRIRPDIFIPLAEETGLINPIGDWVLRQACQDAQAFSLPIKVAVNVASNQLNEFGFPEKVERILEETGLDANRLELEITESGIIRDRLHAQTILNQLKDIGVRIAMDDFGTGYSSLSTLQNFPFDKIKIDREFIMEVTENRHSAAIVKATIILADSLGMTVLAEGVETKAHMAFLEAEGCPEVQGFLFGRPMPLNALQDRLRAEAESGNVVALRTPVIA